VIGKDSGANVFELNGTSEGEEVGWTFEFRAENMEELSPHFFDTDLATTLATLNSKIATT
jgi:hypothetical protein